MNRILYLVTFVAGAAAGSVATYHLVKKKFEKQYTDEIRTVKDELRSKYCGARCNDGCDADSVESETQTADEADKPAEEDTEDVLKEATEIVRKYISSDDSVPEKTKGKTAKKLDPYVIAPEELGEVPGYTIETLTYFADGILAYDDGTKVQDNFKLVGRTTLVNMGKYEDGVIHARNDELKTDFEIYEDDRDYWDVY